MRKYLRNTLKFSTLCVFLWSESPVLGNTDTASTFKPGEVIMQHIKDDYSFHLFSIGHTHLTLPLPVIAFAPQAGFDIFLSSHLYDEHHLPTAYSGYLLADGDLIRPDGLTFFEISITKNVFYMILGMFLTCWLFISIGNRYKRNPMEVPKGMQALLEPVILFVRDEVAKPMLGKKTDRFLPYLLTVFFFIWITNMLGLLPGAANITGNISVTMTLALITFILTVFNGNKHYWSHIFNPPGVPPALLPLMVPIEILGIFTKPFALMIRLFANITAGHIVVLCFVGLIFIFGKAGTSVGGSITGLAAAIPLTLFMLALELLVAFLQAFIFTMLSATYFGMALEEPHHDHH